MSRILLVEDSPTQAFATIRILQQIGHKVMHAKNGDEGVAFARKYLPDLVIMDVVMPGTSGFQATRAIANHKDTENIPIIMLTSKDQTTDKLWAFRQGAMGYLVKPVDEQKLLEAVDHILGMMVAEDASMIG
ncbi:MAG: response regulator [Gammaproteobacteria bacterium]|nr:response regulator [Gammaproteobacteria bacterium]